MSRRVLFMLMAPLLIWHAGPSDAREMCRLECAGHTRVHGAQGVLAKRIVRGRVPSKGQVHVLVVFARFRDEAPSEVWAPAYAGDLFDPNLRGSFSHFYRDFLVLNLLSIPLLTTKDTKEITPYQEGFFASFAALRGNGI